MISLRAGLVIFLLSCQGYVLAAMLQEPSPAPEMQPAVPPTLKQAQFASAVRQSAEKGRVAIQNTVHNLVPGVKCHQSRLGETLIVKMIAGQDFYEPGKFEVADSPKVAKLALGIADVYEAFHNVRSEQFEITLWATGTADAIPVRGGIDYSGLPLSCTVNNKDTRVLEPGPKRLNNELLACARAAALAQDLMVEKKMPVDVDLKGQEHGERGGWFRSVDVEIDFVGLLRYAPDADFCGSQEGTPAVVSGQPVARVSSGSPEKYSHLEPFLGEGRKANGRPARQGMLLSLMAT